MQSRKNGKTAWTIEIDMSTIGVRKPYARGVKRFKNKKKYNRREDTHRLLRRDPPHLRQFRWGGAKSSFQYLLQLRVVL